MTKRLAMLIETGSIQDFVFGNNELAQNIGASELVTKATTDWLFHPVTGLLKGSHNARLAKNGSAFRWQLFDKTLDDGLDQEIVYAGGGNALILFKDEDQARTFIKELSTRAIIEAPGLRLFMANKEYENGELYSRVVELRQEIAHLKRIPQKNAPLLGLGVTAACDFTGYPAVGIDDNGRYISAAVRAKQTMGSVKGDGNQRLQEYVGSVLPPNFDFIYDFNKIGMRDESSYLAVVHTDGNRMGERIGNYVERSNSSDNSFVKAQCDFSNRIQDAAFEALISTIKLLVSPENLALDPDPINGLWQHKIAGEIPVRLERGIERLPFRPIVFGGDDVTFVCDGRLGLPLAANYLKTLAACKMPDGEPLYARAGVAIVKTHFPFARAYALAEELCLSAKKYIHNIDPDDRRISAMDWHFATTGVVQPLAKLRKWEYTVNSGGRTNSLLMRPLRLAPYDAGEWRSYDVFAEIIHEFLRKDGQWGKRRNKVKALREAMRSGPDAVRLLLRGISGHPLLPVPGALRRMGDAATSGWQGYECIHFDAVEALDFNVPLREK